MLKFVMKRLGLLVVALVVISLVIFAALRVLPGDVAAIMAGTNASADRVAALRTELGLDKPLVQQYLDWIAGLFHGNLGTSLLTGRSVGALVAPRAAITFPLILLGLIIALVIGVPLGCAAVLARSSKARTAFQVIAIIGGAVPALFGGILLLLLFGKGVGLIDLFPSQGFPRGGWSQPLQALASLALPALATGIIVGASMMRYTRSALSSVADSSSIAMACACGMTRTQAMLRVGLRLILPQLVSVTGLTFASMVTGVMVIENLFALPGIGTGLVNDLGNRDLIAVQGELFLLAALFLIIGVVVDVMHRLLDRRLAEEVE